jgi:hypothetical protein
MPSAISSMRAAVPVIVMVMVAILLFGVNDNCDTE